MFRRLLVVVALVAAPGLACGPKTAMQKLEAPAAGVTLGYDFTPGQVYRGNVRRSETVRGATGGSLSRGFSFDVTLLIKGPDSQRGGNLVTARYSNVNIRWGLPPGAPISVGELVAQATSQLQGMEVDFNVDDTGKVVHMPELPPDMSEDLRFVVQESLDTLETAFLPVPARPLKSGDTWKDERKRGRQGKLGRYVEAVVTTKVDGFYRADRGDELTKLVISETETEVTTAKTGSHEVKKEKSTEALFAHASRYLFAFTSEQTTFDPGNATTFAKLEVKWTKDTAPAAAQPVKQTQDIDDPCHPDYVGGEECQPAAPPAEGNPAAPPAGDPAKPPAG
jgi:hypothetical protein